MVRTILKILCVCVLLLNSVGFCMDVHSPGAQKILFDFDGNMEMPAHFRTETTGHARFQAFWEVVQCASAPSMPNILKITELKAPSGGQFNICWNDAISFKDGSVSVMVRADRGRMDQGGGPIWRVRDRKNYYVARLNPLEDNFRIYFVRNGRRVMIATADVHGVRKGQWFSIKIETRGNRIAGWVNGKRLIDVSDSTFMESGGVGVWTKADAASSFDNLLIEFAR